MPFSEMLANTTRYPPQATGYSRISSVMRIEGDKGHARSSYVPIKEVTKIFVVNVSMNVAFAHRAISGLNTSCPGFAWANPLIAIPPLTVEFRHFCSFARVIKRPPRLTCESDIQQTWEQDDGPAVAPNRVAPVHLQQAPASASTFTGVCEKYCQVT